MEIIEVLNEERNRQEGAMELYIVGRKLYKIKRKCNRERRHLFNMYIVRL